MKQNTGLTFSAVVMLALIGTALFLFHDDKDPAMSRHADSRVPDSSRPTAAPAAQPAVDSAKAPAAGPLKTPPDGVAPEDVQSYLIGRKPSEVRPDGTQVFKDFPFKVKQKDGSMAIQPATITIQPAAVRPIENDDEPVKKP